MQTNKTIDHITISKHFNDCQTPPGYNVGGQKLGTGFWCKVGNDWYRWTGRNSVLLTEAIGDAHLLTSKEWLEYFGRDLEAWNA